MGIDELVEKSSESLRSIERKAVDEYIPATSLYFYERHKGFRSP